MNQEAKTKHLSYPPYQHWNAALPISHLGEHRQGVWRKHETQFLSQEIGDSYRDNYIDLTGLLCV